MKYSERMRNLREDNDLSQKRIADMLGVAQTTYSHRIPSVIYSNLCGASDQKLL